MKTSVYVSARQIQVIGYTGNTVERYVTYPVPEGTVYNGMITDSALLAECLGLMKRDDPELFKNDVSLVVDGSTILTRRLTTPKLSNKQYLQLVRDDFADSAESADDLVCGFRKLDSTENAILACAVNKVQVDSYISTFSEAGIKLNAIHTGVGMLLSFVKSKPELQNSTIVLNVIDGPTMLSMLFENGNNIFMSRTRLYGDEKEQVFQSVLENLNGLIQFTRSQNIGEITESYYLGVDGNDLRLLDAFNPYTTIRIGTLAVYTGQTDIPPNAQFACLDMLFGDTGLNLIVSRAQLDKHIKSKRPKRRWIPLLVVLAVILAAPTVYLLVEVNRTETMISNVRDYIISPTVSTKRAELEELSNETSFYIDIVRQIDEKNGWEASLPLASSRVIDLIVHQHGVDVTVMSFDFNESTGTIRVIASFTVIGESADYVDALYASDFIRSIDYKGFNVGSDGTFTFPVDITLNTRGAE